MTGDEMRSGVASYGHLRSRRRTKPVELAPKPTVCVCGIDTDSSSCPDNCPTRDTKEPS